MRITEWHERRMRDDPDYAAAHRALEAAAPSSGEATVTSYADPRCTCAARAHIDTCGMTCPVHGYITRPASSVSGTGGGEEPEAAYLARIPESWTAAKARRAAARWWMEADSLRLRLSELEAERDALQRYQRLQSEEGTLTAIKDIARQLADSRRQLQAVQQEVETMDQPIYRDHSVTEMEIAQEYAFLYGFERARRAALALIAARVHPQEGASR